MSRISAFLRSPLAKIAAVVVILGAWGWFLRAQLDALRTHPWTIAPATFAAAIGCGALSFAGLALGWTLLLRSTGGAARHVPLAAGLEVWSTTMLTRYVPGNIWHIVGRVAFAGRLGVGRSQVVASATVEQLLTLLGALALFGLSLPFWGGSAGSRAWLLLLLPAGLLLLHPRIFGAALAAAARALRRPELAWPYAYGELLLIAAIFTLANALSGLTLLVIVGALAPLGPEHAVVVMGTAGLAWAIGYLSLLTPGGLGVREAALTALLTTIVPLPVAIVGSLAHRLALTLGELATAGTALLYTRLRPPAAPLHASAPPAAPPAKE